MHAACQGLVKTNLLHAAVAAQGFHSAHLQTVPLGASELGQTGRIPSQLPAPKAQGLVLVLLFGSAVRW